jgi:hypothetical protein
VARRGAARDRGIAFVRVVSPLRQRSRDVSRQS